MSFSSLRNQIQNDLNKEYEIQGFEKAYLTTLHIDIIRDLEGVYLDYLYGDLIDSRLEINLKDFLESKYSESNQYALECLQIVTTKKHLYGSRIKGWTNSFLKCFDVILIFLIQDCLNQTITKRTKEPKERDVYDHLILKGDNYLEIGQAFQTIYQQRNDFTHVQYLTKDGSGRRETIKWSNRKYNQSRDLILSQIKIGLKALLTEIEKQCHLPN